MKNFIRICIFTCLLFVVFVSNVFAQDRIEEGVLYIEDGTIDISYAKYRRNSEITSVVIPQSVKRIGYEAFRECPNLQTIISETTVGEKALYITQNYIYFGIMYVLLLINKLVNQT